MSTRTRQTRRDRRKAKQSGWVREPKQMGSHVGHGPSGGAGGPKKTGVAIDRPILVPVAPEPKPIRFGAKATIGEIIACKAKRKRVG